MKHGHAKRGEETRTYSIWKNMRRRCLDPKNKRYAEYGGRGITICPKWLEYLGFLEDMGECPKDYSLERDDNDLGYYKENCSWIPLKHQARNRRTFKNNTSGTTGVSFYSKRGTWVAYINRDGQRIYLGDHPTKEAAIEARRRAEGLCR